MIKNVEKLFKQSQFTVRFSTQVDLKKRQEELMKRGLPKQKPIPGVANIILVCSGKGGVGKSTVSVNIATALKLVFPNKSIGLLDADVFGPSVPLMMNLRDKPQINQDKLFIPLINYGVKCMSMGFLVEKDAPVVWRGLRVMQSMEMLMRQVHWGNIEYLIIDTPPGTGDTLLSLVQNIPISGVVLVTTPQSASLEVTKKGAGIFKIMKIPLIGIVENMAHVICPSCKDHINIFGKGTLNLASDLQCDILGSFPLNLQVSESTDKGIPITVDNVKSDYTKIYHQIVNRIKYFLDNKQSKDKLN